MTQAKIDATLSDQVAALERELAALREQLSRECERSRMLGAQIAASPSPSAGAVPEVVVQQGHGKYGAGLWHVRVNGINVGQSDNSNTADHWAEMIRDALKAALPHADAGGEVERLKAEVRDLNAQRERREEAIRAAAEAARRDERERVVAFIRGAYPPNVRP